MSCCDQVAFFDWIGLVADVATPLAIFALGFLAKGYAERLEIQRKALEVESAWRLDVFRELLNHLNNLFCYFTYQGKWLSMSPDDAVYAKQECDRIVHMNYFLWSKEFMDSYVLFTSSCFLENRGRGCSFLLRANVARHRENPAWLPSWEERFVAESERITRAKFTETYTKMMSLAVRDLRIVSTEEQR